MLALGQSPVAYSPGIGHSAESVTPRWRFLLVLQALRSASKVESQECDNGRMPVGVTNHILGETLNKTGEAVTTTKTVHAGLTSKSSNVGKLGGLLHALDNPAMIGFGFVPLAL